MGYFQVRYNSRVINYDRSGFIRLATDSEIIVMQNFHKLPQKVDMAVVS